MLVHIAYGYGLFTGGLGAHAGAERLGCGVVPMSGGMTERQVQLISDFRPEVIMVTPSYMRSPSSRRVPPDGPGPRAPPRSRSAYLRTPRRSPGPTPCARRSRAPSGDMHAVDIYGLSEMMGPGVANECVETKDGLHIWEDHFFPADHRSRDRRGLARGAKKASSSSPRSPRRRCRSSATARATSRGCCPARRARCGAWRRSPGVPTI